MNDELLNSGVEKHRAFPYLLEVQILKREVKIAGVEVQIVRVEVQVATREVQIE